MKDHPTQEEVEAALERSPDVVPVGDSSDFAQAADVRAHVAACADCLARFGPLFELELWAPALGSSSEPSPLPPAEVDLRSPRARRLELVGVAATLLVVWLACRELRVEAGATRASSAATESSQAGTLLVVDLTTTTIESGPDGTFARSQRCDDRNPEIVIVEERREDSSGLLVVHEYRVPRHASPVSE